MKPLSATMAVVVCLVVGTTVFGTARSGAGSGQVMGNPGPAVAVVGDSLAWQAAASIEATLSDARMPARVSVNPGHALSSRWAQDTLGVDEKEGRYKVTVLETASNDAALVERDIVPVTRYSQLLDQLVSASNGRCLVIMNAKVDVDSIYYQPSAALAINRVIQETAKQHPNVRVVNLERHRPGPSQVVLGGHAAPLARIAGQGVGRQSAQGHRPVRGGQGVRTGADQGHRFVSGRPVDDPPRLTAPGLSNRGP